MKRVLVVDDETAVRAIVRKALARAGYEVAEAPNGQAALEVHAKKPFDLLILDIYMPGMDGLRAIEELRGRGDEVPVLAMSGGRPGSNVDGLFLAETLGATKTLAKPIDVKGLLALVEGLIGGKG